MPYSNDNGGGPWGGGGGGKKGGGGGRGPWGGNGSGGGDDGRRPPSGGGGGGGGGRGPGPDIDEIVRRGQEQLRVLMGGRGGPGGGGGGLPSGMGKGGAALILIALVGLWLFLSVYSVRPEEKSVELFLGEFSSIGEPGLNFAPWPLVTKEVLGVTQENTEDIGVGARNNEGLMLTGDENIVDIDFQIVWNIADPQNYLFNLADPRETIQAVASSAMREVVGRSELAPILNRDRAAVADEVRELIQITLDSYESGVNIVRLTLDKVDPPQEVVEAFRDVQAAEQERVTFENQADAYANQRLAGARGEAAQMLEEAEGYRARVVNEAQGEASRFIAVYNEYAKAQDVTRKRLYLETLERVLEGVDKIVIDDSVASGGGGGGQGVVPYLPLNELRRSQTSEGASQ